ncbi:hypothetical protein Hanom_Chr11g00997081 [Helianthus anomalus]
MSKRGRGKHGGRLCTVSNIIGYILIKGRTKAKGSLSNQTDVSTTQSFGVVCGYGGVGLSPSIRGTSDVGGSYIHYPPIEEYAECELLFSDPSTKEKVVGPRLVYPNMDRLLLEVQMEDDYVKVKVDIIDQKFESSPLLPVSCYGEVTDLGDAHGKYIQCPHFAIKLLNTETTPQNQDLTKKVEDVTCYEPHVSGLVTLV